MFNKSRDQNLCGRIPVKGLTLERFLKWTHRFPDSTAVKLDLPWDKIYFQHIAKISISQNELLIDSHSQLQDYITLASFRQLEGNCLQKVLKHQRMTISAIDIDSRFGSIILR